MISLIPGEKPIIRFTPIARYQGIIPEREYPLLYGHVCPRCQNIVQAVFVAKEKFPLVKYEETRVVDGVGKLIGVRPAPGTQHPKSCYQIKLYPGLGTQITLRYHVSDPATIEGAHYRNSIGLPLEVGEVHVCSFTGLFSHREDLVLRDLYAASNAHMLFPDYYPDGFKLTDALQHSPDPSGRWAVVDAIGNGPKLLLLESYASIWWLCQDLVTAIKSHRLP